MQNKLINNDHKSYYSLGDNVKEDQTQTSYKVYEQDGNIFNVKCIFSSEQSKTVLESIVDYLINKQEEQEQSY